VANELQEEEYYLQDDFTPAVKVGQVVKSKQVIARSNKDKQKIVSLFE
jgi:hypothetical protein